jgi:hypothetical protein
LVARWKVAFTAEDEIWFRRKQKTVSIVFRARLYPAAGMAKDDITRLDLRFTNAASPPSRVASDISATLW